MPFRVSFLFGLTTQPNFPGLALAHSAGWSEGVWQNTDVDLPLKCSRLGILRARMLPSQASIIGYRVQNYTIAGLKLIPGPSNSIKQRFAGNSGYDCDVPQMAFRMVLPTINGLNKATFCLRGIPDSQVANGEISTTQAMDNALRGWMTGLKADTWAMVGQNLAALTYNIVSITNGVLKTAVPIVGAVANITMLKIVRSIDNTGKAIKGTYLVTAIDANTNSYTLQGLNANTGASGLVRIASLILVPIEDPGTISARAVVKKVGRPFETYRGRGSRRK